MYNKKISLLLIDEDEEKTTLYHNLLKKGDFHLGGYEVTALHALQPALALLATHTFDLIITTLFLPDSSGIETYHQLRKKALETPIVILCRPIDEELALETITQGAQDYLPKTEITASSLNRLVLAALERNAVRRALRALSFTDELTGLYNRRGFITLTKQQIDLSQRQKQGFYLFLIDLDSLKEINDTFGHSQGDQALISTAHSIKKAFRSSDIVARIGGDEFAAVALNIAPEKGIILKQHLLEIIQALNASKKHPFTLSVSVGMVYYDPTHLPTLDQLMKRADEEMYGEKRLKHKQ